MSFHESASSIELEDGHILKATLRNEAGDEVESELDLNQIIGNDNGRFDWGGENFEHSAENIELTREERDEGEPIPVLRAYLGTLDGENVPADINLAERITNDDGYLKFN
ncbi:Cyanovirin-N [Penicillium rolfsii]|nr:Cyanovirin-N [Penicillium rolfsii]